MMLDMKRTFDEFVEANAEPGRAAAILANPFYLSLSSSFAGTQEYMAMEKLGQLRARADDGEAWDLVIVDTPPSRSALDFLDAPRRLGSFLDGRFIRLLAAPAKAGGRAFTRVLSAGFGMFTSVLSRVIGGQVLTDVQMFVASVDTLFGGFRQRADDTFAMLQAADTAFLVVAAPERDALREASYFVERLKADSMPLAGLVLNRVQTSAVPELDAATASAAAARLEATAPTSVTASLLRIHADRVATLDRQRRLAERFTAAHRGVPVATIPAMPGDVVDLAGLRAVGRALAERG
jgi:anion-transporting  ArsA/GET3 family ATPase